MISVNTLLALLVVGFTVATVISGRVLAQRREIGLLKAVGFAPRNIVALLVAEYLAIGVAAALLGPDRRRGDLAAAARTDVEPARDPDAERARPAAAARRARC